MTLFLFRRRNAASFTNVKNYDLQENGGETESRRHLFIILLFLSGHMANQKTQLHAGSARYVAHCQLAKSSKTDKEDDNTLGRGWNGMDG